MNRLLVTLLISLSTALCAGPGCAQFKNKEYQNGRAKIQGTADASSISGVVYFQESADGLRVHAEISGMPPGNHGFHIHEFGDIGNGGKNAGGHYNPEETPHGYVVEDGIAKAHAGDFGNIEIGQDGSGTLDLVVPDLHLTGAKYSIAGRGVIIHEKPDDFSQPVGNAGSRIAGGTVVLVDTF